MIILAAALLLASICVGTWRVVELNRFDREYILALQLAGVLAPFNHELAPRLESGYAPDLNRLAWPPAQQNTVAIHLHSALRDMPMFISTDRNPKRRRRFGLRSEGLMPAAAVRQIAEPGRLPPKPISPGSVTCQSGP